MKAGNGQSYRTLSCKLNLKCLVIRDAFVVCIEGGSLSSGDARRPCSGPNNTRMSHAKNLFGEK